MFLAIVYLACNEFLEKCRLRLLAESLESKIISGLWMRESQTRESASVGGTKLIE